MINMKRLLVLLLIVLLLSGCQKEKPIKNDFDIETYEVDMTYYSGVTSNNCFEGTSFEELKRCVEEKGSGIFYLGYIECPFCQSTVRYLDDVAMSLNVKVYYIDAYSDKYPFITNGNLDSFIELMYDYLPYDEEDDRKVALTPHVFTIINGKVAQSQISFDPWNMNNPTETQIKLIKARYKEMLEPFVEYFS